jgi:membrane-associated HD superfamily phosphohydrolase
VLYNHELLRKLRIGAYGLSLVLLCYAVLTFRDHNLTSNRLIIIISALVVSVVFALLLKKPNKILFAGYAGSVALSFMLTLFRMRANIALDITLLAIAIGLMIGFWSEARKKSEFAKFQ